MARAIDNEAAYRFLSEQLVKETGAFSKGVNKGLNIARSAMRNPDAIPTLTPPNEWVSRVREIEELYTKLHTVTGFTAEQLLEMFAAGYTLEKADHSKDFEEMANLAEVTPPNEPLTIEQLREMDGEPVWVVYDQDAEKLPGFDPLALWALVEVTKGSVFLTNNLGGRTAYADDQDLEWAGITVYRRPPEGDEGKR